MILTLKYLLSESDDPCDKAYKMIKCYVEYHPEVDTFSFVQNFFV